MSKLTFVLMGFAILGVSLAITDPFDLQLAYAQQTEIGKNYDRTLLQINPDGSTTYLLKTTPEKILDYYDSGKPVYFQNRIYDNGNSINYESSIYSISLDKQTCALDVHNGGKITGLKTSTLSHVVKEAINGTDVWNDFLFFDSCNIEYSDNQIIVIKDDARIIYDLFPYEYEWTYEYTNNDASKIDHKYGFTFVCDGAECGNVTIDNTPLTKGEQMGKSDIIDKSIKMGDKFFDPKNEQHDYTWAMKKEQDNKSIVDFTHSKGRLNIGETLIVDPTFGYTTGTEWNVHTNPISGSACGTSYTQATTPYTIKVGISTSANDCYRTALEWDVSSIPDDISSVDSITQRWDHIIELTPKRVCDYYSMESQPSTLSATDLWNDIGDGTLFHDNDSSCTNAIANDYTKSLSASAITDLESNISGGEDWWGYGIKTDNETRDGSHHAIEWRVIELEIIYTVPPPAPPSGLSCVGLPYGYDCNWTAVNASSVTGYYISHSPDNSTWSLLNITSIGNVTSYDYFDSFGVIESNFIRVNATNGNNGTSSNHYQVTTDNYPDAPTISTISVSDTQIDVIYDSAGASDGGDTVKDYNLQASINGGSWLDIVSNSTHANFYNHTGLSNGDSVSYGWRDGNGVGWSNSGNTTGTTYSDIVASLLIDVSNVGDTFNATGTLTVTTSTPLPVSISLLELIVNGSVATTSTPSETFNIETDNITPIWLTVNDDDIRTMTLNATLTNGFDTVEIASTNNQNVTREYNPVYVPAIDTSYNPVNYTATRSSDQDTITLKVNRDESGGTWQIGCLYQTPTQASLTGGGEWRNATDVGYFLDESTGRSNAHYYITCYNSDKLFTVISYTNSSITLLGIEAFDNIYGSFLGVPVGVFFIVMAAGMANTRTAPMWIVVILGMAGIMSTIGFFTLDTGVWALAIIAGLLGLLVGRKIF